jgi:tetratricopeptide (TPR) repeat protein
LLNKLAQVQFASGDRQGATNSFRQVAETGIQEADLHLAGTGLMELGEATAAVTAFERALAGSASHSPALLWDLADAHRLCGSPERALEVLDQAVQAEPDNLELQLNRADLLVKIGRSQVLRPAWSMPSTSIPSSQPPISAWLA